MQVLLGSRAPLLLAPVATRPATQRACATSRAAAAGTALAPPPPPTQQLATAWLVRRPQRVGLLRASRRTLAAQCAAFGSREGGSSSSSSSSSSEVPDQTSSSSSSSSNAGPRPAAAAEVTAGHRWLQRATAGAALCAAAFVLSVRPASAHRSDARMPQPPAAVAEAAEVSPAYQAAAAAQQQHQRGWRDTGILLAARGDDQEGSGKVRTRAAAAAAVAAAAASASGLAPLLLSSRVLGCLHVNPTATLPHSLLPLPQPQQCTK